jgi:hypothetical protein
MGLRLSLVNLFHPLVWLKPTFTACAPVMYDALNRA